ncbi:MAG: inorganic phosphate transporter [Bryocella sp.]
MSSTITNASILVPPTVTPSGTTSVLEEKLSRSSGGKFSMLAILLMVAGGLLYVGTKVRSDLAPVHSTSEFSYFLLGTALVIALGFEFVNGFHDTANAVATVIYTHSLNPHVAVIWSGIWNFVGVLASSGAVAFTIIALLPVELILKMNQGSGFSMVFALLLAAIVWNLVMWYRGLPVSSSHTMIGSVLGVGVAYQLMHGHSGVNMAEVTKVFKALLFSPLIGFVLAAVLFVVFKAMVRDPRLYKAPEGEEPPPWHIRALLILTCTGISFAHGSNDGQKGMGLIMLILVGTVPAAYALNHTMDADLVAPFAQVSTQVATQLSHYGPPTVTVGESGPALKHFIDTQKVDASTLPALEQMVATIRDEAQSYSSLTRVPAEMQANVRNQMYLVSETLSMLPKAGVKLNAADAALVATYKGYLDRSTQYIPTWVKVAVALALGLGTMVGWKRIVITVGEKIGKTQLTYAQGLAAGLTAMATILGASSLGLPVSTTHVLSSGIAGTMKASGSGLQKSTLRSIAMAWLLTLPAAALLSGLLFVLFSKLAG